MKLTTKPLDKEDNLSKVKRALCSLPRKLSLISLFFFFVEYIESEWLICACVFFWLLCKKKKTKEIIDQLFDVETVTIKVVCCSPEKVADKLCKKGGGAIRKIEYGIENPMAPKPKAPEKPKEGDKPKDGDKPKEAGKPAPTPAASSSQTMIYNSEPGHPMYGGSYNGYNQQYMYYSVPQGAQPMYNGHPSRPIHNSYGGGDWYRDESNPNGPIFIYLFIFIFIFGIILLKSWCHIHYLSL